MKPSISSQNAIIQIISQTTTKRFLLVLKEQIIENGRIAQVTDHLIYSALYFGTLAGNVPDGLNQKTKMTSRTFTTTFYDEDDNEYEIEFWIHPGQEYRWHRDPARSQEGIAPEVEFKDCWLVAGNTPAKLGWRGASFMQRNSDIKMLDNLKDSIRKQWEKSFDLEAYVNEQKEKAL